MYKLVPPDKIPVGNPVPATDLVSAFKLATAMSVLCVKESGVGLSAVQVGVPLNLFVVKNNFESDNYLDGFAYWINTRYESVPEDESKYESLEGCLSLRDSNNQLKYYVVPRFSRIRVIGQKLIGASEIITKDVDMLVSKEEGAAIYAHEIDHGFGITIDKIGTLVKARKR